MIILKIEINLIWEKNCIQILDFLQVQKSNFLAQKHWIWFHYCFVVESQIKSWSHRKIQPSIEILITQVYESSCSLLKHNCKAKVNTELGSELLNCLNCCRTLFSIYFYLWPFFPKTFFSITTFIIKLLLINVYQ